MTFNTELAVRVLANIEEGEEVRVDQRTMIGWDQSHWGFISSVGAVRAAMESGEDLVWDEKGNLVGTGTCGTAMCFAGWALSLSGVKMKWDATDSNPETTSFVAQYTADGKSVEAEAGDLLGMNEEMFHGDNLPSGVAGDMDYSYTPLFHEGNDLNQLYVLVAHYSGMSESELRTLVQDHRQEERARLERIRAKVTSGERGVH